MVGFASDSKLKPHYRRISHLRCAVELMLLHQYGGTLTQIDCIEPLELAEECLSKMLWKRRRISLERGIFTMTSRVSIGVLF